MTLASIVAEAGASIIAALDRMDAARAAIAAERARRPGYDESDGLFLALMTPPGFEAVTLDVYAAHARELVARDAQREPLDEPTHAEVLVALSQLSLRGPVRLEYSDAACAIAVELGLSFGETLRVTDYPERIAQVIESVRAELRKQPHVMRRRGEA